MSNASMVLPPQGETTVPVVGGGSFPVRRIYCVGRNYISHIREMKEADERDPPFFFQKPRDSIVTDGSTIPYPPMTDDYQYEVELVIAVGKQGADLSEGEALDYVWGYGVGLDMTRRDRQRDARAAMLPWEVGKAFDHCAPCGALHRATACGPQAKGAITLEVNGAEKQRGDLEQMIWNCAEILVQLSRQVTLMPGDLIMTGTPAGVAAVHAGDVIVAQVEGLAPLTIHIGPKGSHLVQEA